jgi:hypothetical protein
MDENRPQDEPPEERAAFRRWLSWDAIDTETVLFLIAFVVALLWALTPKVWL